MESESTDLDAVRDALDGGDPETALELWRRLDDTDREHPSGWALGALVLLDLELPVEADKMLASGAVLAPPDDRPEFYDWCWARAEVDLAHWRLEEARAGYAELRSRTGDSTGLALRRALLSDLEGHSAQADRELREAERLDSELVLCPPLDETCFGRLIEEAARELPPIFAERLEQVPVLVDPVPSRLLAGSAPVDTPPDALGLFVGPSDLDRGSDFGGAPGPVIYLFQRNLERSCTSVEQLGEEVQITLLHEFGHLLGFDEDGVDALGLA